MDRPCSAAHPTRELLEGRASGGVAHGVSQEREVLLARRDLAVTESLLMAIHVDLVGIDPDQQGGTRRVGHEPRLEPDRKQHHGNVVGEDRQVRWGHLVLQVPGAGHAP